MNHGDYRRRDVDRAMLAAACLRRDDHLSPIEQAIGTKKRVSAKTMRRALDDVRRRQHEYITAVMVAAGPDRWPGDTDDAEQMWRDAMLKSGALVETDSVIAYPATLDDVRRYLPEFPA